MNTLLMVTGGIVLLTGIVTSCLDTLWARDQAKKDAEKPSKRTAVEAHAETVDAASPVIASFAPTALPGAVAQAYAPHAPAFRDDDEVEENPQLELMLATVEPTDGALNYGEFRDGRDSEEFSLVSG